MRGTLLNTATIAVGAGIGWSVGAHLRPDHLTLALSGLGLVTGGMGLRMFLSTKQVLIVAAAISLGAIVGSILGIDLAVSQLAEWARQHLGGQAGRFNQAFITTSVLYCVGPMTLLGCMQDGIEGKIELLALKSTMDGICAVIFATVLNGPGVLASAAVVLVFQGSLTLLAKPLRGLASSPEIMDELTATGGLMLLAIGLSLLEIKKLPVADFLPALLLAPFFVWAPKAWKRRRA